ncbi:hypothetical protein E1B28_001996 [Marasmius oreades]|uniref:Amidohydrolase-related domain-containing protein n=1 Tax=Marasmius oreades TaxID=181124 RepID=A0A9P7V4I7_9AGAR|nr:uncharacterized protein E1B28_001996 [Marasmius oreades]KAG7100221.1 hypothetical protein E1B28_001996 [Marasmius oreades]
MQLPTDSEESKMNTIISTNTKIRIIAGKLFNSDTLTFSEQQVIVVDGESGLIIDVHGWSQQDEDEASIPTVDLRGKTVLPGFVDVHVHMFLHSYAETPWDDQLTKESLAERTIRATVHAKKTLMVGFTTVRDLGTEGAEDADIALRKSLSGRKPLIPGPRYFCANRAIVASGSYGPKSTSHPHQEGIDGVTGAAVADGVDGCIREVRKQIGTGADWVKVYADYKPRSRIVGVSPRAGTRDISTFNEAELKAMIDTAHAYGVKIAAHAQSLSSFKSLISLGIDSIEHSVVSYGSQTASLAIEDLFSTWMNESSRGVVKSPFWIPTLAVYYKMAQFAGDKDPQRNVAWDRASNMFRQALSIGFDRIACGGDTGAFSHGENALEMKLMVRLGADVKKVLGWATLSGWECVRGMDWEMSVMEADGQGGANDVRFGCIKPGWAADIVAVGRDIEKDFESALDSVEFVMKEGRIYKWKGTLEDLNHVSDFIYND